MDRGSKTAWFCWTAACYFLFGPPVLGAVPVDAYGNLPSIEQAALSPDGSTIAFIQTALERRILSIVRIRDSELLSALVMGDIRVRDIQWADDEHLLVTTASNQMPMGLWGERIEWHL